MKPNLFLDFDMTIVDSVSAFVTAYNIMYCKEENFIPASAKGLDSYSLYDVCALLNKEKRGVDYIFGSERFFELLGFINENTYEVLEKASEKYKIIICSIGVPKNIAHKLLWIEQNIPFVHDTIMLGNSKCDISKAFANMKDGIFIDDVSNNLFASNASRKACFGDITDTNVTWVGKRLFDYYDVADWLDV